MTVTSTKLLEPRVRRWTREEFYCLAEQGYFKGERVQLIEGEVIEMSAQGHAHVAAVVRLNAWAVKTFTPSHHVRIQMPLNVSADSDPEPDLAIVPGPVEQYRDHPETAKLVIEVSDSSLQLDHRKIGMYAGAGVTEYWIVNLPEHTIEVYREPDRFSKRYGQSFIVARGGRVSPVISPDAFVLVDEVVA